MVLISFFFGLILINIYLFVDDLINSINSCHNRWIKLQEKYGKVTIRVIENSI